MAANASQHDAHTAPTRRANRGIHGCVVPEHVPTLPLAARVRLDLLDDWNAANKAAREAYRARPFADQRCR